MIEYQNEEFVRQELMSKLEPEEASKIGCLSLCLYWVAIIIGLLFCAALGSCCPCRNLVNDTQTVDRDSTDTKVKIEIVYVPDTVFVEIPEQKAERTTADSTSHLENDYAKSDARINPDGTLYHSLETKPQEKPVEFQKPIEKKDSVVTRYKYIKNTKTVTVEKKLSWWEQLKIDYGGYAITIILIVVGFIVFKVVRKFTIK